jgi:UDP:flavonoid glycosyltransferase YjiC (YdhE family)
MRVLFSSLSAYGHFFQLIPLAVAARDAGHHVVFATDAVRHPLLTGIGLDVVAAGRSTDDVVGEAVRTVRAETPGFDGLPQREALPLISARFSRLMPQAFVDDLLPEFKSARPDLVIHGAHNPGAGLAARVAGIPAICHGTGRVRSDDDELMVLSGSVLHEYAAELGVELPDAHKTYLGHQYLDICPPSMQNPEFMSTIHNRTSLRPVPFNPPAELPAWVRDRARDKPLVYLTMGTESDSVELLRQALDGLSTLDAQVLVATGKLEVAVLGPVPDNAVIERWVPQADLLPYLDLIVHHGGNGTTFAAMSAGVPQLFLQNRPGPDQSLNSDMLCATGAGERLLLDEISAEAVADTGKLMLADPERVGAAQAIAKEIAGMPAPREIARRLPEFA